MHLLQELGKRFMVDFEVESGRYIVFAGLAFLVLYVLGKKALVRFKIQQKFPEKKHIFREVKYSFLSLSIFLERCSRFVSARPRLHQTVYEF